MRSKFIAASLLLTASLAAQYVPPGGGGGGSLPTGSDNCVVASPANGSSATVACRALVAADEKAAGATGAVQFNNAGVPGGAAVAPMIFGETPAVFLTGGSPINTSTFAHPNIMNYTQVTGSTGTSGVQGVVDYMTIDGSGDFLGTNYFSAHRGEIDINTSGSMTATGTAGPMAATVLAYNSAAAHIDNLYGQLVEIESDTGTIGTEWATYSFIDTEGGSVGTAYNIFAGAPTFSGGATMTTYNSFWGGDLGGLAITNPYYSWFDSRGVRRVKEDVTFNSVGQAIEALYNPQFTKYTPGATDFERVVLGQFNSNVAEIGTEAGGTGVLRPLRLIGASVAAPGAGAANTAVCWKAGGVIGWASNTAGVIGTTCN